MDKGREAGGSPLGVWVWLEPSRGYVDRKHGGMRKETPVGL